ncbi:hypothetical protein VQ042_06530 [Aurantimonas sp. A2-1-M11]|uniref:hypothetical protein n=1 Tax=Aurantimonas sp. A2-1-M11 TaxID=3113712 RepID=UPI002F942797
MRKFRNFFRAVMNALKSTVRIPVILATGAIAWVWDVIAGPPVQAGETQEIVEIPDSEATMARTAIEDAEADRKREAKMAEIAKTRMPGLVKMACETLEAGKPLDSAFFAETDDEMWIDPWVRSLDATDRMTVRHMPDDSLLAHLDGSKEQHCLPSYQKFDFAAARERMAEQAERERIMGWSALEIFRDLIDQAVDNDEVDRVDHLALWVRAQRLAGVDEEDIDHGPYGPD